MSDIYQDIPDEDYRDNLFCIQVGEKFKIAAQCQHGFVRVAVFTTSSCRWASPILVNDADNFILLLQECTDWITMNSVPDTPVRKLKLIRKE
jgi:hypothetical protein